MNKIKLYDRANHPILMHIRNWVPGILCPTSRDCESGTKCQQSKFVVSKEFCHRGLLARDIKDDIMTHLHNGDYPAYRKTLELARDNLAPLMTTAWRANEGLVSLINSILETIPPDQNN
jgi:hypothetical protein